MSLESGGEEKGVKEYLVGLCKGLVRVSLANVVGSSWYSRPVRGLRVEEMDKMRG